jgi:hypothetical protein
MADDNGHEDRLQRVESYVTDFAARLAENTVQTKSLQERMDEGFASLRGTVEDGFNAVHQQLDEGAQRMDAMAERIGEHGRKLEGVDQDKRDRAERVSRRKKVLFGFIGGIISIAGKEIVVMILRHYGH